MKKILIILVGIGILSYLSLYWYTYSTQDNKFKSQPLSQNYKFQFDDEFEEINLNTPNNGLINSLLFKSDSSQGVVCFWKGNGGTLERWGHLAPMFLELNYDVIITDYRGHGKSKGKITMDNFYSDSQAVYDFLKTRYSEGEITIVGYSLGTTLASHLSTSNDPKQTVLIEPKMRFSADIFDRIFFLFPTVNIFSFSTENDIKNDKTLLTIITGTKSGLYVDARELRNSLKESDNYFEIKNVDHGSIGSSEELKNLLAKLLSNEKLLTNNKLNEQN